MAGLFLEILRPLMWPRLASWNISLENTSDPKMKRKGERGSPCLRPLAGEIKPNGLPLMRMEKEEEEMHASIQPIQTPLNPSFFMMASRKGHSIWSNAFSMSILRNIKPFLPLLFLKVWISSWASMEFSWIFLPGTKANWRGEIILGRTSFNLLARILEMIL